MKLATLSQPVQPMSVHIRLAKVNATQVSKSRQRVSCLLIDAFFIKLLNLAWPIRWVGQ